ALSSNCLRATTSVDTQARRSQISRGQLVSDGVFVSSSSNPDWMDRQVEFWNERARQPSGTGVVPFRALEYAFVTRWICGTRILDAGCGVGEIMTQLKLKYDDLFLVGFDMAEEMVKRTKEKHQNALQMNMLTQGFQDRVFDTAIAV